MSKELAPLEALDKLSNGRCNICEDNFCENGNENCPYFRYYNIIKTALEDYERRLSLAKEYEDVNNVAKRLLAFEIIKEKGLSRVEIALIKSCKNYEEYRIEMLSGVVYNGSHATHVAFKSEKEFDLLKKILK